MKRLSILVLALCIASEAGATPIITDLTLNTQDPIVVGSYITVQFSLDREIRFIENIDFVTTGLNIIPAPGHWIGVPEDPHIGELIETGHRINDASCAWQFPRPPHTVLYEFDVYVGEPGWVSMEDVGTIPNPYWVFGDPLDEAYYTIGELNGLYIPEPATLVLLGLCVLFVRNRKRWG